MKVFLTFPAKENINLEKSKSQLNFTGDKFITLGPLQNPQITDSFNHKTFFRTFSVTSLDIFNNTTLFKSSNYTRLSDKGFNSIIESRYLLVVIKFWQAVFFS